MVSAIIKRVEPEHQPIESVTLVLSREEAAWLKLLTGEVSIAPSDIRRINSDIFHSLPGHDSLLNLSDILFDKNGIEVKNFYAEFKKFADKL